ncbi:alpha/beta hydrolase [Microlunatus soli]|uniref:Alpha/beta hydrolase family protein n=1 Tax=Microlunatus soli TaxID=630515 RepID=A0A1H1P6T1_9ACTN|nr:alpha/beta hydrolase [Microlunatus soli]SDS06904.1 Alpha/beta hydrolase family protein [Microlunatus soli]
MAATFVLIHGSNANSFGFAPLQRELALLGHRSLAVDLPGHGFAATFPAAYQAPQDRDGLATAPASIAEVGLADNIDHVAQVLRRVREHGPTIVVAHSRGGVTLTGLGNAVPDMIDRMVYLSAWCCVRRTPREYWALPEFADSLPAIDGVLAADPAVLGAVRTNWRTADPEQLRGLKELLLADGTDDEFRALLSILQPDENRDAGGPDDLVRPDTWGRIPHSYLRLTEDRSIPIGLQDLFIAEADSLLPDNPFDVHTLQTSHVGPLVRPAPAAAILASLVDRDDLA